MRYQDRLRSAARFVVWRREIDIPDRTLAIGPAENLSPVPGPAIRVKQARPDPARLMSKDIIEGYEGFPGRGSVIPPEKELMQTPYYGPALAGV